MAPRRASFGCQARTPQACPIGARELRDAPDRRGDRHCPPSAGWRGVRQARSRHGGRRGRGTNHGGKVPMLAGGPCDRLSRWAGSGGARVGPMRFGTYNPLMTTSLFPRRWAALLLASLVAVAAHAGDGTPHTVPDTLAQRIASCTACHGEHGEGTPDSGFFPRLAGKPADYLARQLRYFQQGLRKYGPMEYTARPLSDAYM